ncbi:TfoX/Sxy family protein [Aquabacterium sp. A7-Y]|uniref:TfoX/Sxy family protein n=1 Tax=Aquabacterium sp. A7-Y TaxID=1349605 RepID=UPI00223D83AB|nr:TfoX/Sxy family protein [Aquabacterium sp. A7-Y]MCW7539314.1 TfoX/Sxy family protein [Aquabacterium sp. A7-Y]
MASTISAAARAYADHCLELLQGLGPCAARRMFGGWGIHLDGVTFGLIVADRLYLKADAQTEARWREAGGEPFVYQSQGKAIRVLYYTPPDATLESPLLMLPWARLALEAALRARATRSTRAAKPASGGSAGVSGKRSSGSARKRSTTR